jgi:hypothetical protein
VIRAQRRRHMVMWVILAPLALAGLAAALLVRAPRPVQEPPPGAHAGAPAGGPR